MQIDSCALGTGRNEPNEAGTAAYRTCKLDGSKKNSSKSVSARTDERVMRRDYFRGDEKVIEGARALPAQHLTIRVPWHDSGWAGTFCQACTANTSCIVLPRIATARDDAFESLHRGESIELLDRSQYPPCVDEHGTFMAKFPLSMQKKHPYAESAKATHGHFSDTPYTIRPYSAAGIPFRWMLREQVEGN